MKNEEEKIYRELLEDIKDWMHDNDYECGEQGSIILKRIVAALRIVAPPNN